jgi:hypothetical protein
MGLLEVESVTGDRPPGLELAADDVFAPPAISTYATLMRCAAMGAALSDPEGARILRSRADHAETLAARMIAWQSRHPAALDSALGS